MARGMGGLRSLKILPRAFNAIFAASYGRLGRHHLSTKLWDLEDREGLSLFYLVTHIHINAADVSSDLSVDINFLVRTEFPGERKGVVNRSACD
jgi:hypothetical protein